MEKVRPEVKKLAWAMCESDQWRAKETYYCILDFFFAIPVMTTLPPMEMKKSYKMS